MLLDRIDIDAHGPLHHVELGPFAEHLNVIFGPPGSGKTAIARFIRDSLIQRDYPQGMLSASSGRIVWADRNGLIHCRREQDGTVAGRRTVEFESRGEPLYHLHSQRQSWFGEQRFSTDSSRAIESLQLPESIVDGVITDTAITSVARVVSACVRSGLDSPKTYQALPLHDDSTYHRRDEFSPLDPVSDGIDQRDYDRNRRLRQQLSEVEAELFRLRNVNGLGSNQREDAFFYSHATPWNDSQRQQRLSQLHDRTRQLQAQQSELRRWVAEIDRELNRSVIGAAQFDSAQYQVAAAIADQELRCRLEDLDAQMIRWRRALSEVRGLRDAILSDEYPLSSESSYAVDEGLLRRQRLNGFLYAVDHYDHRQARPGYYPEYSRSLQQIDDLEFRFESATRQIDWLLKRYADPESMQFKWYYPLPQAAPFQGSTSLGDALRHIREDLYRLRTHVVRSPRYTTQHPTGDLNELQHSEHWLVASIEQLNRHRESLLQGAGQSQDAESSAWAREGQYDSYVMHRDRKESVAQLERVTTELGACLREAADVRRSMRHLPVIDSRWTDGFERSWTDGRSFFEADRHVPFATTTQRRIDSLRQRRSEILGRLRVVDRPVVSRSPLSDAASGWLVRLTGGRLRRVAWPYNLFGNDHRSYHRDSNQRVGVTIDGRDEQTCSAADRAVAVWAVRMAAGDLLARTGRHVPLVLETNRDVFDAVDTANNGYAPLAYHDNGDLTRSNSPIASALRDYTRAGRQVVLITSNQSLAAQISRVGARSYQLHARSVVHAHRPLWKSHYGAEHYVGPHPHTYGHRGADELGTADVNRDFDMAWREAYGLQGGIDRGVHDTVSSERTDWSRDGYSLRDGYYVAKSFTTNELVHQNFCEGQSIGQQPCCNHQSAKTIAAPVSPFFLTVDSPIDQAPSVDAVAAARLRGLKVTHVNHLMQQDSNRLADALGLASVDAATIRRWQAECRLVCRVPQLRGFDARVLVGCGVTTPAQLAAIHPVDLLQQVEAFLATNQGQKILLSGSSQELSRITSWIAAANTSNGDAVSYFGDDRRRGNSNDRRARSTGRTAVRVAGADSDDEFDSLRYEYETGDHDPSGRRSELRGRRRLLRNSNRRSGIRNGLAGLPDIDSDDDTAAYDFDGGGVRRSNRTSGSTGRSLRSGSRRSSRSNSRSIGNRSSSSKSQSIRSQAGRSSSRRESNRRNGYAGRGSNGEPRQSERQHREPRELRTRERSSREGSEPVRRERTDSDGELKFYLQRESMVVDAPSIGAKMAERLNAIGIESVDELLNADAETVSSELDHRQVDADTVLQWQQQATLVCRVPMLRGHDAQLLVAAEVTTPEELAECDADELFGIIDAIARSSDGKRIIRGGKRPDLAEVTDWINYGRQHRELMAA